MGLAQPRWIAQSERMRLKQIFEACDDDRSGELSKGELKEGLARLGMPPGDEEMDQLWQAVDSDGSGALSLEEFVVAVSTLDEQMRDRGVGAKVVGGTMGLMGDLSFFVRNTAAPMRQFLAGARPRPISPLTPPDLRSDLPPDLAPVRRAAPEYEG